MSIKSSLVSIALVIKISWGSSATSSQCMLVACALTPKSEIQLASMQKSTQSNFDCVNQLCLDF